MKKTLCVIVTVQCIGKVFTTHQRKKEGYEDNNMLDIWA